MKVKKIAICMILALGFHSAFGQELSFKGGVNLSTVTIKNELSSIISKRKAAVHLGAFFNYQYTREITISPEILYFGIRSENLDIHFLTVPLIAKYFISPEINIHAGPQLNILLGASESADKDVVDGLRRSGLSLGFGGEAYFDKNFGVGARYVFGLTDMESNFEAVKISHTVLQLSLLYFLK